MNLNRLFIFILLILLGEFVNASSFNSEILNKNQINPIKEFLPKTEIFIDNDSKEVVWVSANGGSIKMLIDGYTLRLYNNEEDINEVHIKISKTPLSEIFFNALVPNHTTIKVKAYLPKPITTP